MQHAEAIEDGVGRNVETLYSYYGIEITEAVEGEVALLLSDDLYSTYDVPRDLPELISDITYIIEEGIY